MNKSLINKIMTSAGVLAIGCVSAMAYPDEELICELIGLNCRETCWDITTEDGQCAFLRNCCNGSVDDFANACNAMCEDGEAGTACHNSCGTSAEEGHSHCNEGSCDTSIHVCYYDDCIGGTLHCYSNGSC